MGIKTSLKQLVTFFAQSAATEELSLPVRRFAAQLTILGTHAQRIESTAKRVTDALDVRLATLEALLAAAQQQEPHAEGAAPGGVPSEQEQPPGEMNEDDEVEAMASKALAETEADLLSIQNGTDEPAPAPEVVVVPAPQRKNNGKKATQAGGAA